MTMNCKGNLIDLQSPKIMGILNITPDSFYAESRTAGDAEILKKAEKLLQEGADFLDVGGYSSRPDAREVLEEEELNRVVPAVELILKEFPEALISVDTFRAKVAAESLEVGAAIINDISAGNLDENMMKTVAKHQVPYVMMHIRGTPQTMKTQTKYDNLVQDILYYFSERINRARELGINDLIIDPGFGFAKTIDQNYELFRNLELFKNLELPFLVGISRKSMLYKKLGLSPETSLNATTALNSLALSKGASILRVHDAKEAVECVKIYTEAG